MAKVTELMATKIDINTVGATKSLKNLQSVIRATANEWKTQEIRLKSAGKNVEASKARYDGLTKQIQAVKEKLKYLNDEQAKNDRSTEKAKNDYLKLTKQINSTEMQLASLVSQQKRAYDQLKYQESGLASLQRRYTATTALQKSYIDRLEAEGKAYEASNAKVARYKSSIDNLSKQLKIQESELKRIASTSGATSSEYIKQKTRVNETATAIAKYSKNLKDAQREQIKLKPTAFNKLYSNAQKLDGRFQKIHSSFKKAGAAIIKNATGIAAGIGTIGSAAISGAKKAQNLQQSYKEITNLAVLGGEKQKEVVKAVAEMQKQGQTMSIKYGKSQESIAEAYEDLVKRGYTTKQALGAMQTELQASVASGDNFKDVVTVSSQVLEGFGMRAKSTAGMTKNTKDVVNQLAYAADMTSTGFQDLGVEMSYVSSIAHQANISLASTSSAMGILSNNGLELLAS